MKIYIDNCCYNRLYDNYTDIQSVAEEIAIEAIIEICKAAGYVIVGSPAVMYEIDKMQITKPRKWADVRGRYEHTVTCSVEPTPEIIERARSFNAAGLGGKDHFHLAYAEAVGADVLLTTDKRFINTCARECLSIVNVMSPVDFLPEVEKWAQ